MPFVFLSLPADWARAPPVCYTLPYAALGDNSSILRRTYSHQISAARKQLIAENSGRRVRTEDRPNPRLPLLRSWTEVGLTLWMRRRPQRRIHSAADQERPEAAPRPAEKEAYSSMSGKSMPKPATRGPASSPVNYRWIPTKRSLFFFPSPTALLVCSPLFLNPLSISIKQTHTGRVTRFAVVLLSSFWILQLPTHATVLVPKTLCASLSSPY